jgi:subtilisin family serine protease
MVSRLGQFVWGVVSLSLLASCAKEEKKFNLSQPHQERQLIVTYKQGTLRNTINRTLHTFDAEQETLNNESVLLKFRADVDLEKIAEELSASHEVAAVEANVVYKLFEKTPNDPEFSKLYGMKNSGQSAGVIGADIGATAAWEETTGSKGVLVAIVDSGMDYNHSDLKDNVWTNPGESGLDANGKDKRTNGIDDDGNGFVDDWRGWDFYNDDNDPMDDNGHGTHVAGTIGAVGNNESGIVGVNWSVSMVPIKVFSGSGATTTDMLVKGVEYATTLGVFVSNNSWGGGAYSDAIYSAIKKASDKGILFAAAAGNEGENNDVGDHYPSNYDLPNIISVAAINRRDNVSAFSNYGANTVDVAAPGEDIYSTLPNGLYGLKSGTSMATPHVTGALALIRSRYPQAAALEIKEKLLASTVKTAALDGRVIYGRINVANSMETDVTSPSIVTGLDVIQAGLNNITISWNLAGDDGDRGEASSYALRLSDAPLTTTAEWDAAEPAILSDLKRTNLAYTASIKNLAYNRSAFITIRAIDNVGNVSDLSESIAFNLLAVDILWSEENDSMGNWDAFGTPWGISKIGDIGVLSDSPDGPYASATDKSAVTKDIALNSSDLVLEVRSQYELEKDYDWGYIELSVDRGLNWKEVGKITGASAWTTSSYSLKEAIGTAKSFRIRLRLKSDQSVNYEGWDIDSLKIVGQKG